uniref:Carboxylesterase 2 n=1 Tax=Meteorus pulchricornis TaxID=51522 RepID=A0A4D6J444_9HYME|nr:carboxylesterase 2 [Meteorus pulchricornis]
MVFFHSGGFMSGSGNDMLYGPDFLVENDIVLVTMNYRLGVIGFLNTGNISAPGNIGLKDQNLALKWIQENIINFSGCPKRVTIFGQGSGATSVHYHMLSPMSQGLFKSAILQSGTAVSPWAITYTPKDNAMALGEFLGLNASNTIDLVEKLKDINGLELAAAVAGLIVTGNIGENSFVPTVESDVGQEIFLSNDPWTLIKYGDIADVPTIIGLTKDESKFMIKGLIMEAAEYQDHLCKFIPDDLNITDPVLRKEIAETFSEFYFNKEPIKQNIEALTELLGDAEYNHGPLLSARIMNSRMSSPVYEYLFNYFTSHGILKNLTEVEEGIVHCDDLVFLFHSNYLNNTPESGSNDAEITDEMVEMWTNFAKKGNPSVTMKTAKIEWEPMGEDEKYLDINQNVGMKNSLFKERVTLWANLYSDILDNYVKLFN